jgi:hypothetical protein
LGKQKEEKVMLLENGTYKALVRDISVYLRGENERLTGAFRLDCEGKELVHREWLELNDGTISDKTIRRLRDCFTGWDGSIEMLEQGFCVQDVEVDVTIENERDRDDPEKWWTRVRYMDPPGGAGGSAAMPQAEQRATLVSKYGSRFRALAGGTPAKPGAVSSGGAEAKPKTVAAGEKSVAPPPPQAAPEPVQSKVMGETSTLEECWEAVCKKHPDELREQVSERWFAMLAQVAPGKDQADFGPEDWGAVLAEVKLPF